MNLHDQITIRGIVREELHGLAAPQLLRSSEAAKILKVHPGTLPNWRKEGVGPDYVVIEGVIRYELSALHEYINSKKVKS